MDRPASVSDVAKLDFPREWFTFIDPDDAEHEYWCDVTWLLSNWGCIYGRGCPGITRQGADEGCCSHGAYFADEDDELRVRAAARELKPEEWQNHEVAEKKGLVEVQEDRVRTRVHKKGCIFLNRAGFRGGAGCALHALALRTDRHPIATKPDVCWQLPLLCSSDWEERLDGTKVWVTTIGEFNRRAWGSGGHDLDWWCTETPEAQVAAVPLYESYRDELIALIGEPAYEVLRAHCEARREAGGPHATHPATDAAG